MRENIYTFEQHQEIGKLLFLAREALIKASCELHNNKRTKLARLATKSYMALDSLRCELDSLVFEEHPERPTQELASTYYCASRIRCSTNSKQP